MCVYLFFYLVAMSTTNANIKLCDFTSAPNEQFLIKPITSPKIKLMSLNLIAKEKFGETIHDVVCYVLANF